MSPERKNWGAMRIRHLEIENERLRTALVHADLKIRSMPGTDQSDVDFIRAALSMPPAEKNETIRDDREEYFVRYGLREEDIP